MQYGLAVAARVETWRGGGGSGNCLTVGASSKSIRWERGEDWGVKCVGGGGMGGQNFSESCIWAADNAVISISLQNASSAPSAGNL